MICFVQAFLFPQLLYLDLISTQMVATWTTHDWGFLFLLLLCRLRHLSLFRSILWPKE